MTTVKITNKANTYGIKEKTHDEFVREYSKILKSNEIFSKDVLEFSELMAKHPADIFIITSFKEGEACEQIRQGDIYLFRKGEETEGTFNNVMYEKYISTVSNKKLSNSMNLQLGEAITGDHKIIPLKNTKVKIYDCIIQLPIPSSGKETTPYNVKMVMADGAFGLFHREHGNITCQKGTYLACTQMDARTMTRVTD